MVNTQYCSVLMVMIQYYYAHALLTQYWFVLVGMIHRCHMEMTRNCYIERAQYCYVLVEMIQYCYVLVEMTQYCYVLVEMAHYY